MRILITGATGFVGRNLIPYLYSRGLHDIAIIVRYKENANELIKKNPLKIIVTNDDMREQIIAYSPEIVIHLATFFNTHSDVKSARLIIDANITFGTILLESLSNTNCRYFINLGTFAEYLYGSGEYFPNTLYAASKTAFRSIIQYYQLISEFKWVNVIGYTIYGRKNEHKKVIDYMVEALSSKNPVSFSKGEQIFDYIHVDDVVDFFYTLLSKINLCTKDYQQFHLGTGVGTSLRNVAEVIEKTFGKSINAKWGDLKYRPYDAMFAIAPIALNIETFNWKAKINLQDGIAILKEDIDQNDSSGK